MPAIVFGPALPLCMVFAPRTTLRKHTNRGQNEIFTMIETAIQGRVKISAATDGLQTEIANIIPVRNFNTQPRG